MCLLWGESCSLKIFMLKPLTPVLHNVTLFRNRNFKEVDKLK